MTRVLPAKEHRGAGQGCICLLRDPQRDDTREMQSSTGWLQARRTEEALGVPQKVLRNPLAKGL